MSNFCKTEYLQERLAAVCKERDELKKLVEKQARMNRSMAAMALELDNARAEIDRLSRENFWLTGGDRGEV